ncbi:MAG: copper chaperone CopZ [Psychromonas sp.]|jgi:copper chaperone CopZ
MRNLTPFIFSLSILLVGCSSGDKPVIKEDISSSIEKDEPVLADRLLTLEIEGMTCIMGCGGSIRSELKATNAIESCEFEFESGRAMNTAKVAFDKNKITVDEIIDIVTTMNKGQFKVGGSESENITVNIKTRVEERATSSIETNTPAVVASTSIEMPNFVEILASFFHN